MTISEAYAYLEKDETTPLYFDEFSKLMRHMHPRMFKADMRQLFMDMDLDGGGLIEMSELDAYWPTVVVEVARLKARDDEQRATRKQTNSKGSQNTVLTPAIQSLLKEGAAYFVLMVLFVMLLSLRRSVKQTYFVNEGMERIISQQPFGAGGRVTYRSLSNEVRASCVSAVACR